MMHAIDTCLRDQKLFKKTNKQNPSFRFAEKSTATLLLTFHLLLATRGSQTSVYATAKLCVVRKGKIERNNYDRHLFVY